MMKRTTNLMETKLKLSDRRMRESKYLRSRYPVGKILENPGINSPAALYQMLIQEEILNTLNEIKIAISKEDSDAQIEEEIIS